MFVIQYTGAEGIGHQGIQRPLHDLDVLGEDRLGKGSETFERIIVMENETERHLREDRIQLLVGYGKSVSSLPRDRLEVPGHSHKGIYAAGIAAEVVERQGCGNTVDDAPSGTQGPEVLEDAVVHMEKKVF